MFAASTQAASDLGITLELDRLEPENDEGILIARMASKITALCADGVDGLFVTIPSSALIDEIEGCQSLGVVRLPSYFARDDHGIRLTR